MCAVSPQPDQAAAAASLHALTAGWLVTHGRRLTEDSRGVLLVLLLYLGWEGVGLCSYLLIGFWYKHWYNGYAARKAFVVTRVGDTAMIVGLFLLFTQLGTLPQLQVRPTTSVREFTQPNLDVIAAVRADTRLPLAAYNVSGEYAMVKAAVASGAFDERAVVLETLTAIRRAGADMIVTYHAEDAARWLAQT